MIRHQGRPGCVVRDQGQTMTLLVVRAAEEQAWIPVPLLESAPTAPRPNPLSFVRMAFGTAVAIVASLAAARVARPGMQ